MGSELPAITPDKLAEIKLWLWISAALILFIALPFIASWYYERKSRILRTAYEYYCSTCRRGTVWTEDKGRCTECLQAHARD